MPGGDKVKIPPFRFTLSSESVLAIIGAVERIDRHVDPSTTDSNNLNIVITPGCGYQSDLHTTNFENFKLFLNGTDGGGAFNFSNGGNMVAVPRLA